MKFTLRQLSIFLAVARHQNISKAAEELHMSQSAASEALMKFEENYQIQLFDRSANRMTLTQEGKTLRREAENILAQCNTFEQMLEGHEALGHLKVGASYTIANHLVTRFLSDYLDRYPQADVKLEIGNTPDVVAQILNYEVDVGLVESEVQHRSLELIPWMRDELVVFCSPQHPLAEKGVLSVRDVRKARWILREPESGARHTFDRALAGLITDINIYLELKHNEAIKNAVETGLGLGCLSRIVLQKNLDSGELVPLQLPRKDMSRTFYFALPKNREPSEPVEYWMQVCAKVANS